MKGQIYIMKKKILIMAMIAAMSVTALAGCGSDAIHHQTQRHQT